MIEEESLNMIEAIAVIDIDPSLTVYNCSQQKWLTGIQITTEPAREKKSSKLVNIAPGIYLILTFCENNKHPIYEIEFMSKPVGQWIQTKGSEQIQNILGSCLCYKTQPNELSGPICDIQLQVIEKKNRFGQNKDIINVPQGYKLISHQLPLGYLIFRKVKGIIQQTFKPILAEKYCPDPQSKVNMSQLPLFCFPDGIKLVKEIRGFATFNFIFTMENADRIYVTCLIFKQNLDSLKREKLGLVMEENIFYEKALCISSKYCYTDQFSECLQHLYRLSLSKSQIPFYRIIECFSHQLIYPSKQNIGKIGMSFTYGGINIRFTTNDRYPIVSDRALYSVFKFLTIDNIINVFQALLLEKKILFVSQSKTILGYAIEAFTCFLFPFRWEQVLIPILPYSLKEYLTAPVPLVAGISPSLVDSSIQDDSIIVFLDKNEVLNDEDLPPLPEKLLKQLKKRLQKLQIYDQQEVNEFLQNPESTYLFKMQQVQDPHFQSHIVRDIFFQFILTLMRNYKKFISKKIFNADSSTFQIEGVSSFTDFFKVQSFLSDLGMTKVGSFGYKFTESSIFTSFIEKVCKNHNDEQIMFFDQCIERKKAKKQIIYIEPITNTEYKPVKNPQIDAHSKETYFYQKFPSLLKESIKQQEIEVQVIEEDPHQIEQQACQLIQEQYYINCIFFQQGEKDSNPSQFQQILYKMNSLLLNSNKKKLQNQLTSFQDPESSLRDLYDYFLQLYNRQTIQIEQIFDEWPKVHSESEIEEISKFQYLKRRKEFQISNPELQNSRKIVIVKENNDCQILIRGSTKISLLNSGDILQNMKQSDCIALEIKSHRLKSFMDSILPKQSNFFIDYIQKQNMMDLRKSAFKKIAYRSWNIETLLNFRDWIHYQKQFGTGVTTG